MTQILTSHCRVIKLNHGNVPVTFKQFECLVGKLGPPSSCAPDVDQDTFENCKTPVEDNHDRVYGVPQYNALELDEEEHEQEDWVGGEKEALKRLALLEKKVCTSECFHNKINFMCSNHRHKIRFQNIVY